MANCRFLQERVRALIFAGWVRNDLESGANPSADWIENKAFASSYTEDLEESQIGKSWAAKFSASFKEWHTELENVSRGLQQDKMLLELTQEEDC